MQYRQPLPGCMSICQLRGGSHHASSNRIFESQHRSRSGLGLEAQRHDIEVFAAREGFAVKSWHQDVQTGAGANALLLRPGLATALKEARSARCPLIVSRLDRLSRNVHFISLMEHRVHFLVLCSERIATISCCTSMHRWLNRNVG